MGYVDVPVVNRIYVSDIAMYQQYMISLYSLFTIGDQFECNWEPYVPPTISKVIYKAPILYVFLFFFIN
jgi:hypothetical protein